MHNELKSYFPPCSPHRRRGLHGCTHCMQAVLPSHTGAGWQGAYYGNVALIAANAIGSALCRPSGWSRIILTSSTGTNTELPWSPRFFLDSFRKLPYGKILSSILELGFNEVLRLSARYLFLRRHSRTMCGSGNEHRPVSAFCPAVVRLIQVKFPALTGMIMPLKPPVDLAAQWCLRNLSDAGIAREQAGLFYITPCAAKIAAIKSPVGEPGSVIDGVINMNSLTIR